VLVVGDLMVVVSGGVERMPRSGENVLLSGPRVHVTGVAANVALNLRALGFHVAIAGAVGEDAPGSQVIDELERGGVDVRLIDRRADAETGAMVVMVEPDGQRTMVGTRGASERFELDPTGALAAIRPGHVHVSGYVLIDPVMEERCDALIREAHGRGATCSVDLEGIAASGRRTPLERVTILCNRDEFAAYFGIGEPTAVSLSEGRSAPIVLKDGAHGCYLIDRDEVTHVPVESVGGQFVDTTGAGDAFDAAFIAACLRGHDPLVACRWGNVAGATTAGFAGPRMPLAPGRAQESRR
jgi:sugar/nucleoside kinase (ribokinase family)